ncbi:MAG: hypothetical protein IPI87_20985 [Betaproteobacteria bacterium]|nr:hypothetical protein [Betaproteobacteria bacterium]
MRSAMSGACFANVSDFSYWRDLAAFNRRCLAHVLQMFLIFPAWRHSAMSGACFANVSDFSYWRDLAACVRRCLAHVLQMFLIFPTGGTWRHSFGDVWRMFCKCF